MKYKCIKGFLIEECDGDGFTVENEYMEINKGTLWETPEDAEYRMIDGEIRLENYEYKNEIRWVELCESTLKEHFEVYIV